MAYYRSKPAPMRKVRKYPKSKKAVVKKALRKSYVNSIKKIARSVVKKQTETKIAQPYTQNNQPITAYDLTTNNFGSEFSLITPLINILQGTGQGQRVGNRINVTSMIMKGYINAVRLPTTGGTGTNDPFYVKMVWLRRKSSLLGVNGVTGGGNAFFQNGNATVAPSNLPTDLLRAINKDVFTVYTSRVFKLGFANAQGNISGNPPTNNDFKVSKFFKVNLSKHIGKLIYDDNGANPNNWACYAVALMCTADGTPITSNATTPICEIHFDVEVKYKDM